MTGRGSQLDCSRASRSVAGVCDPGAPSLSARRRLPRAFTLIELLITVSIIAIMASMILFALYGAGEAAKTAKTRAMIAKIDAIIKARWESYQTRRVPIDTTGLTPPAAARARLDALRDLMRMELPDRWTDVADGPATWAARPISRPGLSQGYLRKYNAILSTVTGKYEGAECLYMIVMGAVPDDADGREVFKGDQIGDVDGDGAPELLDGWGQPIKFLRWAPGFQFSELQIVARGVASSSGSTATVSGPSLSSTGGSYVGGSIIQLKPATAGTPPQPAMFDPSADARIIGYTCIPPTATITLPTSPPSISGDSVLTNPDPFDPSRVHTPIDAPSFALYPLVYSAGPDKCYGIMANAAPNPLNYADNVSRLNPFITVTEGITPPVTGFIGTARNDKDEPNYVENGWGDNIHNHLIGLR